VTTRSLQSGDISENDISSREKEIDQTPLHARMLQPDSPLHAPPRASATRRRELHLAHAQRSARSLHSRYPPHSVTPQISLCHTSRRLRSTLTTLPPHVAWAPTRRSAAPASPPGAHQPGFCTCRAPTPRMWGLLHRRKIRHASAACAYHCVAACSVFFSHSPTLCWLLAHEQSTATTSSASHTQPASTLPNYSQNVHPSSGHAHAADSHAGRRTPYR
jgi:hypothetical protein